jgi:hypothetical protein
LTNGKPAGSFSLKINLPGVVSINSPSFKYLILERYLICLYSRAYNISSIEPKYGKCSDLLFNSDVK